MFNVEFFPQLLISFAFPLPFFPSFPTHYHQILLLLIFHHPLIPSCYNHQTLYIALQRDTNKLYSL